MPSLSREASHATNATYSTSAQEAAHQRVVVLDLLHGRLGGERVLDDRPGI